jgi:hypothetical protein
MSDPNPEKRSVSTDALATLGTIIGEGEKRDAIHLAVEPTVAAEKLYPGQDVGVDGTRANPVGIVDPFLKSPVMPGDRFWLVVYPRQINSLRHVWTHPAFPDEIHLPSRHFTKTESEKWLRNFAGMGDVPNFDIMIEAASGGIASEDGDDVTAAIEGDALVFYGTTASGEIPPEFWDHLEVYTGKRITKRPTYFSCSC